MLKCFGPQFFMQSKYIKRILLKQRHKRVKELQGKETKYKKTTKTLEKEIESLQAKLVEWEAWAIEFKDATTHSYDEAARAAENRRQVEHALLVIQKIINDGDRGAVTALHQISGVIDDYYSEGEA